MAENPRVLERISRDNSLPAGLPAFIPKVFWIIVGLAAAYSLYHEGRDDWRLVGVAFLLAALFMLVCIGLLRVAIALEIWLRRRRGQILPAAPARLPWFSKVSDWLFPVANFLMLSNFALRPLKTGDWSDLRFAFLLFGGFMVFGMVLLFVFTGRKVEAIKDEELGSS